MFEYWIYDIKLILIDFEYSKYCKLALSGILSQSALNISGEYNEPRVRGSAICNLNYDQPRNAMQICWKYNYNPLTNTNTKKYITNVIEICTKSMQQIQ